ncbi:hypothetical protein M493_07080 [Geobacillus genomosp. 3]|uniref:Uncharacterized protein n=1 Tax=Geobacillus genomosp. 3 TaxID=1921421 RepID=S5ZC05_GEOG3|nr:hypothetical protein M493_07080 [Geobacillus genomosp. 3]
MQFNNFINISFHSMVVKFFNYHLEQPNEFNYIKKSSFVNKQFLTFVFSFFVERTLLF